MNDLTVTVAGWVATDVSYLPNDDRRPTKARFRIASNSRKFDSATASWINRETIFITVDCFRYLAENTSACVYKGQPVLVTGRLKFEEWTMRDGTVRETPVIDARALGHDLAWGTADFARTPPRRSDRVGDDAPWGRGVDAAAPSTPGTPESTVGVGATGPGAQPTQPEGGGRDPRTTAGPADADERAA